MPVSSTPFTCWAACFVSLWSAAADYDDVNCLPHDPPMHAVVDSDGLDYRAASTSQIGRFKTRWLTGEADLAALAYLLGA